MTIPMGRITRDYLLAHRLCPHQCAPNFFRVLGPTDALDRHLGLGLTWYDVAHLYEGHMESRTGFYLKSRSSVVKLISCLPKSNKGMKDDYLIPSGPWSDGLPCLTKLGEPRGTTSPSKSSKKYAPMPALEVIQYGPSQFEPNFPHAGFFIEPTTLRSTRLPGAKGLRSEEHTSELQSRP